jgi:DNA-binding transcriptional LysR family regulator
MIAGGRMNLVAAKRIRPIVTALLGVILFFPLSGRAAEVRMAGSDWLGAEFEQALRAFAEKENVQLSAAFQGSRPALDGLKAGKIDLAIVALAPDEEMPDERWVVAPWAYRVAVIVAPQSIDLTQISFTQLEGFFGASGPAGFTFWRDVGVKGQAAQLAVGTHVLANRRDSASVDIFRQTVLRVPRLKSSVTRHEELTPLKEKLATEEGGLAVLPEDPADGRLRVLAVSKDDGEPAYSPSRENIHTGDYPLRTAIFVVYRSEAAQTLRPLLTFLWSDEAARSVAQGSYCVPIPASARPAIR